VTVHDQISAALQRAAELAPDGRRIQAELDARVRRYRQRRALLVAATAAAGAGVVAATVPTILRTLSGPLPSDYPMVPVPRSGPFRVPMLLRPGWLPTTMVETNRIATLGERQPSQTRLWRIPNGTATSLSVRLDLHPAALSPIRVTGHQTVNGHRIPISADQTGAVIAQIALAQRMIANVAVSGSSDDAHTAARIADSLAADGSAICAVSLRLAWLPPGMPGDQMTIGVYVEPGTGALHQLVLLGSADAPTDVPSASAEIGGSKALVSGTQQGTPQPVTVRGRPGTCTYEVDSGKAFGRVVVELADGRWLAVGASGPSAQVTRPVLLRMVAELVIGPDPAINWGG
jgi:hypothetical protein